MTAQQMVALCARLFATWLFLLTFRMLTLAIAMKSQTQGLVAIPLLFGAFLPLLTGVVLWKYPMFIANKFVPRTSHTNTIRMPAREMAAVGSALLGMWTIIESLPTGYEAIREIQIAGYSDRLSGMRMLLAAAQFCAGVFLLSMPWFLANKVFPARANDQDFPESPNPLP